MIATVLAAVGDALGLLVIVLAVIAGATWGWTRLRRRPSAAGDPQVAAAIDRAAPRAARRVAAVVVDRTGAVRAGYVASDESSRFEIGSVSKGLTGMLLAEQVETQNVALTDRLAQLEPRLAHTPVGEVSIEALCTHRSGLPRLPRSAGMYLRAVAYGWFGVNPYSGLGADRVAAAAGRQRLGAAQYSNLGAAVLGNALAAARGTSYSALLRERVLRPAGLDATGVEGVDSARAPHGHMRSGRRSARWVGAGFAPAGGLVSTPADLAKLVRGLLTARVPGVAALQPRQPDAGIGMFWITGPGPDGTRIAWHNGQTGGYAAFVAVDVGRGHGVVVLIDAADSAAAERLGRELLAQTASNDR